MKEKCSKYEALFTFLDENEFKKHLEECEDCREQQAKMDKVSALIQEVKPVYLEKRKSFAKLKIACAAFAILLSGTVLGVLNFNTDLSDMIRFLFSS